MALGHLRPERDGAAPARASFGIAFERAPPPEPDHVLCRWAGRYGLTLGKLGDDWLMTSALDGTFRIDPLRHTIRCFATDVANDAWRDVLVRRVLPRATILTGACVLHAAAVAVDAGALLLLGESGAGKSTLSAALGLRGWDILSDDVSILWDPQAPAAEPTTTGVCLWRDSRDALALPIARCAAMPGYDGKARFVSGHDTGSAPVPLRALIFLARAPDCAAPTLEALSGAEGMSRAARQRVRFDPADPCETRRTFETLGALTRATPGYRLTYPADYAALPLVEAALRQLVRA